MSLSSCSRFIGRVAAVTGGSGGIGAACVRRFVDEGAKVAVLDRDVDLGMILVDDLNKQRPGCATFVQLDMRDESSIEGAVESVSSWSGGALDVWVNNAASFVFGDVRVASREDWLEVLETNVMGMAFGLKHAAPVMIAGSGGAVVNMASISSFIGQPGFTPYTSSKSAILGLTRTAAIDLAAEGVRVNAVAPGPILTSATERHAESQGLSLEAIVQEMQNDLIIPRMGSPQEVAAAVAFLASDDASYITGTTIAVDGGYLAL